VENWKRYRDLRQALSYAFVIISVPGAGTMLVVDYIDAESLLVVRAIQAFALAVWALTLVGAIACGILERRARKDFPSMDPTEHR
jgi:hypothetical protein